MVIQGGNPWTESGLQAIRASSLRRTIEIEMDGSGMQADLHPKIGVALRADREAGPQMHVKRGDRARAHLHATGRGRVDGRDRATNCNKGIDNPPQSNPITKAMG
jgi:hypothetical protein